MTEAEFSMSTYTRISGFRAEDGTAHRAVQRPWGPGMVCSDEYAAGTEDGVLVREITCEECLDSLPGIWEVQVPDKRFKTGARTIYTGFAHKEGAESVARQSGRKDAKAVGVTMRELLELEGANP